MENRVYEYLGSPGVTLGIRVLRTNPGSGLNDMFGVSCTPGTATVLYTYTRPMWSIWPTVHVHSADVANCNLNLFKHSYEYLRNTIRVYNRATHGYRVGSQRLVVASGITTTVSAVPRLGGLYLLLRLGGWAGLPPRSHP